VGVSETENCSTVDLTPLVTLRHPPRSQAVLLRIEGLRQRFGEELQLRELIYGDFLLLYSIRNDDLYLLSIKHHRQLSFGLHGHLTE
jgi:hypothetical protein